MLYIDIKKPRLTSIFAHFTHKLKQFVYERKMGIKIKIVASYVGFDHII